MTNKDRPSLFSWDLYFKGSAPVFFLLLITAGLFFPYLNPHTDRILSDMGLDLSDQFVWWRQFGFEELKKGHLALWNPHLFCGAPFFGGFQSALLYPPNWLFMVLPLAFALNLSIALHVFLAGWFTHYWLRRRGNHEASALMGSFMVMFGAAYFLHLIPGHLPNLSSMAWIPLVLAAVEKWRDHRKIRWIWLGAFAIAMMILAGHVQYVYYMTLFLGLYLLLGWPRTEKKISCFVGWGAMYLGAGLLTAIQLLAGWDAAWESVRGKRLSMDILDTADMTPERLWCLLMPNFFGHWQEGGYWGGGMYWEGAMFVSVTAFVLALFALKVSPHPEKKIFGGMAILITLVAVGKRTPLFGFLLDHLPMFANFRGVGKLNILITLCLVALAAMGMDEVMKGTSLKGLAKGTLIGSLVFGALSGLVWILVNWGHGKGLGKFGGHSGEMAWGFLLCALVLAVLFILCRASEKFPNAKYGFLALALVELLCFAGGNLISFSYQDLKGKVAQIQKVYDQDPGDYRVLLDASNITLGTTGGDIWGNDPMIPLRYASFVAFTQGKEVFSHVLDKPLFWTYPNALALTRLKVVFREKGDLMEAEKMPFDPMPRALLVGHWEICPPEMINDRLKDPAFDFKKTAYLETDPGFKSNDLGTPGQVELKDLSTDRIEVTAQTTQPALLVISDNYSKGWKVSPLVPTAQTSYEVLPANGFQRGIPLTAGNHHFILEYSPRGLEAGKWISILSWVFFILLGLLGWGNIRFLKAQG